MLAIASLATGFVVAAVTPSHADAAPAVSLPGTGLPGAGLAGADGATKLTGGETNVAGVNVDKALNTVGKAINRETDRAVNNAPHGKKKR